MGSQILRPTRVKRQKGDWLIQGPWGRREYPAMRSVTLYEQLRRELISAGVLPPESPLPSNRYHDHVTLAVIRSSWIRDRWVSDEPFAARLKSLREEVKLTQEKLAEKSGLDVGTVRQLEQGARTSPWWQTVCALARALEKDVVAFVGTEGWQPPDPEGDWKWRQRQPSRAEHAGQG
jgi:DNA-binding XRE family transcriptional regulator